MATRTRSKSKGSSITRFLENIVDDSKDLVDDWLDTAKDLDKDLRKTARRGIKNDGRDDDDDTVSAKDLKGLKNSLSELTAKVQMLTEAQAKKN